MTLYSTYLARACKIYCNRCIKKLADVKNKMDVGSCVGLRLLP